MMKFLIFVLIPVFFLHAQEQLPYVYTEWESFTTESTGGQLINDHIFFLEADGDSLWIGTEGGLVLYYKGTWTSWTQKDGLPWNVVMGIVHDKKTGELWCKGL